MVQMKLSTKASQSKTKKCSETMQTLCTGCSKVDPQTNKQTGVITIHCTA